MFKLLAQPGLGGANLQLQRNPLQSLYGTSRRMMHTDPSLYPLSALHHAKPFVTTHPPFLTQTYDQPPPAGISVGDGVEFEVLLVSFDREGYWQNMEWTDRWALADRLKDKGNALFKAKKYKFASNK